MEERGGNGRVTFDQVPAGRWPDVRQLLLPAIEWAGEQDSVVQRTDGTVLYNMANVVDDFDMQISHVIRAEEHLPNTPRQCGRTLWAPSTISSRADCRSWTRSCVSRGAC